VEVSLMEVWSSGKLLRSQVMWARGLEWGAWQAKRERAPAVMEVLEKRWESAEVGCRMEMLTLVGRSVRRKYWISTGEID